MNHLATDEAGSAVAEPLSPFALRRERHNKQVAILRRAIFNSCAGQELGFFFIPKKEAFRKMQELVAEYSSNISVNITPPSGPRSTSDEDISPWDDEWSDYDMKVEYILSRASAKIAASLLLNMGGSMRVVTLDRKPIHSFPVTFAQFGEFIRMLKDQRPFHRNKRWFRLSKKTEGVPEPIIYFKMWGRVPEE